MEIIHQRVIGGTGKWSCGRAFVKSEGEETSISTREAQSLAQVSGEVCQRERER